MDNKIYSFILLLIISLVSALDSNFSIESKYGKGDEVFVSPSGETEYRDYIYNEHILDAHFILDKFYFYSQFEYSKPPVLGDPLIGLNNFYLEYSTDKVNVKIGDIYTLYGRGLTLNMFQDQVIDYDNSLRGLEARYYINDNMTLTESMQIKTLMF